MCTDVRLLILRYNMFSTGQKLRTVETRVCIGILYSKRPSLFIPWKISCYSDVIYVEENLGGVAKGGGEWGHSPPNVKICTCKILFKRRQLCFIGKGDRLLQSRIYTQSNSFKNISVHYF